MEVSHEDNHGLPNAQAFAYLLCTNAVSREEWVLALLLEQGGKHEHETTDLWQGERVEQLHCG